VTDSAGAVVAKGGAATTDEVGSMVGAEAVAGLEVVLVAVWEAAVWVVAAVDDVTVCVSNTVLQISRGIAIPSRKKVS